MKVLRVSAGLDAAFGGPPNSTANSAIAAHMAGMDVTVVFPHKDPALALDEPAARRLVAAGVTVKAFKLSRGCAGGAAPWGVSMGLAGWLWRHTGDFDVIHAHSAWAMSTLAAVIAAKRKGRPVVLSPHESLTRFDLSHAHNLFLRGAKYGLLGLYRGTMAGMVFSSNLELRDSRRGKARRNWTVIHHPVDAGSATQAGPRQGTLTLGYLGRLHPKKNIEALLAALAELPPTTTLTIAGAGDPGYEGQLKAAAARHDVASRVTWRGFVNGDEKGRFLTDVDLLVMPSHYECFGMAAAEAMAAGVPVVVSNNSGIADVVRSYDAGLVVDPAPAAIGDAVRTLTAAPNEIPRRAANGIRAARDALSTAAHGRALRSFYEKIVA